METRISSRLIKIRQFGYLVGGVAAALGTYRLYVHQEQVFFYIIVGGVVMALIAWARPASLGLAYDIWMKLAAGLSWVMTRLFLSIIFFGLITPLGILAKLAGKRFLDFTFREPTTTSYWREVKGSSRTFYDRQF